MARFIPSPAGGGIPPGSVDHFAPRYIVGNVPAGDTAPVQPAPFQYIPDSGDGAGIATALAAAAISGGDIWIRRGTYDFAAGAVATPLTIPAGVRVRGEGGGGEGGLGALTIIGAPAGNAALTQDCFVLGANASLEDLAIIVPAGAGGGLAGVGIVQTPSDGGRVAGVSIIMSGSSQRNTSQAISSGTAAAPGTGTVIERCNITLPTALYSGGSAFPFYTGVLQGYLGIDSTGGTSLDGPTVREVRVLNGEIAVLFASVQGGRISDITHMNALCGPASVSVAWFMFKTALSTVRGPMIRGVRFLYGTSTDGVGRQAKGVVVENQSDTQSIVREYSISDIVGEFTTGAGLVSPRIAVAVRSGSGGGGGLGSLTRGVITNVSSIGQGTGVQIECATANNTVNATGALTDLTITNVVAPASIAYGAFIVAGLYLLVTTSTADGKISTVGIVNCDFRSAPAAGFGISVGAHVQNTIVVGNNLVPVAGTALADAGVGTQITANILV